jgi:hypothetical protein
MKYLLVLFVQLSLLNVHAQEKYQLGLASTVHFSERSGIGYGAHVNANAPISGHFSAGLSIDMVNFQHYGYWEIPVAANFIITPEKTMFLTFEPGYTISSKEEMLGLNRKVSTKGSFYAFAGVGYKIPAPGKVAPVATLGATYFSHAVTEYGPGPADGVVAVRSNPDFYCFSFRLGFKL